MLIEHSTQIMRWVAFSTGRERQIVKFFRKS